MKKWMYIIFPAILLTAFLFYYRQEMTKIAETQRIRAEQVEKQKAEDEAKKKEAEEQAKVSAEKRARDQKEADEKVAAEKEAKYQATSKQIKDETDQNNADADRFSKEASELEIELDALHQKREKLNREDFDLLKQVELTRVAQQTADMEIQRKVEMIARKADESAMAQIPPPVPVKE
jgi:hypothetical protein